MWRKSAIALCDGKVGPFSKWMSKKPLFESTNEYQAGRRAGSSRRHAAAAM